MSASSSSFKPFFKIIILGDAGVGKSSLMVRFVNKDFSGEYKATIGADFLSTDVTINGKTLSLQVWDTAGQERFVALCIAFFRGSDACVLVYDINDEKSVTSLATWKDEFLRHSNTDQQNTFPFFAFGNKIDDPGKKSEDNIANAKAWAESQNIPHFTTSAKNATGVDDAFNEIAKVILERENLSQPVLDESSVTVKNTLDKPFFTNCC